MAAGAGKELIIRARVVKPAPGQRRAGAPAIAPLRGGVAAQTPQLMAATGVWTHCWVLLAAWRRWGRADPNQHELWSGNGVRRRFTGTIDDLRDTGDLALAWSPVAGAEASGKGRPAGAGCSPSI